jgi:hypothetical protein
MSKPEKIHAASEARYKATTDLAPLLVALYAVRASMVIKTPEPSQARTAMRKRRVSIASIVPSGLPSQSYPTTRDGQHSSEGRR